MPAQTKNRPAKLTVDFTDVEDRRAGKPAVKVPPGDYLVVVKDYEIKAKQDDASRKYINWQFYIEEPSGFKGQGPIYYVSSLVKENLWSLRNLLEDIGVKVPKSMVDIPLGKIPGRKLGVTLDDDTYSKDDGKTITKSKVQATFPAADFASTGTIEGTDEEDVTEATTSDDEDIEELDIDDI